MTPEQLREIALKLYAEGWMSPDTTLLARCFTEFQKLQDSRIVELEAELEFDQRNAAMSQAESLSLLKERDELKARSVILREALQAAVKVHGYTSGVLVDALNATSGT